MELKICDHPEKLYAQNGSVIQALIGWKEDTKGTLIRLPNYNKRHVKNCLLADSLWTLDLGRILN